MHVLIQKSMKRTPLFIKKIWKNLWSTTNYLFWWIVRGDGNSHSGQNGAGKFVIKIRVSVSNGHCSRGESGDPIEPRWLLWKAKMVPNTQQGEILTVQLLEMGSLSLGDILHPGNVTLFPSSPTSALCSNLTGAVSGLEQKQSSIFPCTQWQH